MGILLKTYDLTGNGLIDTVLFLTVVCLLGWFAYWLTTKMPLPDTPKRIVTVGVLAILVLIVLGILLDWSPVRFRD